MTNRSSPPGAPRSAGRDRALGVAPEWQTLRRRCLLVAKSLGLNSVDAEDLAQEAISRLLPVLPAVERPVPWLGIVVRNLVHEKRRSRAYRARLRSELVEYSEPSHVPTSAWRAKIDLRHTLLEMPPRSRRILELVLAGHTHREIATLLQCEVHQVGPRISRALKTARRRLRA